MKNRRFPYGYEMQKGQIAVSPAEAETVRGIFQKYMAGANLKDIAEALTQSKTEYLPGEYGWNKSRIKRMIEDKRYTGEQGYPPIIAAGDFSAANAEKDSRRTFTVPSVSAENKELIATAICGECGGKLIHRTDNAKRHNEAWYCADCKNGKKLTVTALEKEVTAILNRLIAEPALTEHTEPELPCEPSLEIRRMENEIERMLEALDFDKTELQSMILQCAAKKYDACKSARHITDRLKADFEKSSPLSNFNTELFSRTVSAVIIDKDKTVTLQLKNNKIIGKEATSEDDTDNSRNEKCPGDSAEAGILR